MKTFQLIILTLSIALLAIATQSGLLMNYLFMFLLVSSITMVATFIVAIVKKQIYWRFSAKEFKPGIYILRGLLRNSAWIVIGICVYVAIIPIQFSSDDFPVISLMIWGAVAILCLLDWVPRKQIGKSLNVTLSLFLIFLTYQLAIIYLPAQATNSIKLTPAFKGDWYVFNGGNSMLINHHYFSGSQKYALDIILPEDGELVLKQVTDLQQYKTFGSSLYSPVDGVIVTSIDSLPDQKIGTTDRENPAGNHIVIKAEENIFFLLAHLQKGSVLIAAGDQVKTGQKIAKIGNSGNSSQPHLHIQAMTNIDFMATESKPVLMLFQTRDKELKPYKRNDILSGL